MDGVSHPPHGRQERALTASPSTGDPLPPGLRGDIAKLFSERGTNQGKPTLGAAVRRVLTRPGPLAIVLYRLSHQLWRREHAFLAELLWRVNLFLTDADIHPGAEIGPGLRLTHTSGLVIGMGAKIGANCTILHDVTIGGSGKVWFDAGYGDGFPEIGDETEIWSGAKVLGPIRIGRGCHIGANAVVSRDLPDGASYTPGQQLRALRQRVDELEAEVARLRAEADAGSTEQQRRA